MDEVDVFNRLEFELFAFGIIPTSASLPLLKDREVVYVNLLPPRPPTPWSITVAPPRDENSLVAEVRRPGTGQPFEVVYTQQPIPNGARDAVLGLSPMKRGRFKEHLSEGGSRPNSPSVTLEPHSPVPSGSSRPRSATRAWYKENERANTQEGEDPFVEGDCQFILLTLET